MDISIVIPVYNEAQSLDILIKKIVSELTRLKVSYEILLIDDGSTDNSFEVMCKLKRENKNLVVIQQRNNFGKSTALATGFKLAKGDIIITMDADLQDDPKEIPRFINKINEGYDLVSGWKVFRKDPITKKIHSKIFNWLTRKITKIDIHDFNCGFKAYKKDAIKSIQLNGEFHRYIPALLKMKGYKKIGEIQVDHHPRPFGKSKYGIERIFKGFIDLITLKFIISFLERPSHILGSIGLIFTFLSFLSLGACIFFYLSNKYFSIPLFSITILLFVGGLQFIAFGLMSEMIIRTNKKDDDVIKRIL